MSLPSAALLFIIMKQCTVVGHVCLMPPNVVIVDFSGLCACRYCHIMGDWRLEVFTAVALKIEGFWDVKPCCWVSSN
jgi:hypothetical protein